VADVDRVLGLLSGALRIGQAADRDGVYFHYITAWLFALHRLGTYVPSYRRKALALVKAVHPFFVTSRGIYWKMKVTGVAAARWSSESCSRTLSLPPIPTE
jgi:hypothetical protein